MRRSLPILTFAVLATACGSARPREELPFLEDRYGPGTDPVPDVIPDGLPEVDGDTRRLVVTAPSGRLYALRWVKASESLGGPADGRLVAGRALPAEGPGFRHIGKRPFGTDETIVYLMYAAWAVEAQFPGTAPVIVGDVSPEGGGRAPPHRSHRSGRDADVGLYRTGNRPLRWFEALPPGEIDAAKTWTFIEALLRTRAVQYVFLDRAIQERLVAHARDEGWAEDVLARVFQAAAGNPKAAVRHIPGHRNHLHVRFRCPAEDASCVP